MYIYSLVIDRQFREKICIIRDRVKMSIAIWRRVASSSSIDANQLLCRHVCTYHLFITFIGKFNFDFRFTLRSIWTFYSGQVSSHHQMAKVSSRGRKTTTRLHWRDQSTMNDRSIDRRITVSRRDNIINGRRSD